MLLLVCNCTLSVAPNSPGIQNAPFLGGVLHGAFEHVVRHHAPLAFEALGGYQRTASKYYAILPPPYSSSAALSGAPQKNTVPFHFGILLFNPSLFHVQSIAHALTHLKQLRLYPYTNQVESITCSVTAPELPMIPIDQLSEAYCRASIPAKLLKPIERCRLEWMTPLKLASKTQKRLGFSQSPPDLLRVVRSLKRRLHSLEPHAHRQLGIDNDEWIEAEEALRTAVVLDHSTHTVDWIYGSSTQSHTFKLSGIVGNIDYQAKIAAPIHALLQLGTWLGIGEHTAMGQGMYCLHAE